MNILPIVDDLVRIFRRFGDTTPEMNGKLPDKMKSGCIPDYLIDAPDFSCGVLHQIHSRHSMNCCVSASSDEALVRRFENCFPDASVSNDHKATQVKEGCDANSLCAGAVRPYSNDGLDDDFEEFSELEEIWQHGLDCGQC